MADDRPALSAMLDEATVEFDRICDWLRVYMMAAQSAAGDALGADGAEALIRAGTNLEDWFGQFQETLQTARAAAEELQGVRVPRTAGGSA